jgi:hypothetical protein
MDSLKYWPNIKFYQWQNWEMKMLQTLQVAYSKQKMFWSREFEWLHAKYNPELLEDKRGHRCNTGWVLWQWSESEDRKMSTFCRDLNIHLTSQTIIPWKWQGIIWVTAYGFVRIYCVRAQHSVINSSTQQVKIWQN